MEKERKIRILSIGALLVAIIGLTVAFAAMSRTLIINGTATIDSAKWDIHFANPLLKSKKGDAREVSAPEITNNGGDLTLKVGLRKPQDEIVYNVDVVNAGDIDAEITKIDYPELSEDHAKIIEFEAVYDDGSSIALSQELKAGDSKKVKITIRFKDIEDESLLASEAYNIPLTFKIHYTQSGVSNGGEVTPDGGGEIIDENSPFKVTKDGVLIHYERQGNETSVTVPAEVNGIKIKKIAMSAFMDNVDFIASHSSKGIIGVSDNEQAIELANMMQYTYVTIDNYIEEQPFDINWESKTVDDYSVITIDNSQSEVYLPSFEFKQNFYLKEIDLSETIYLESIGAHAFYGKNDIDSMGTLENVVFPNSDILVDIGEYAFSYNPIEYIQLEKVKSIGNYAFSNLQFQGILSIPSNVEKIGNYAFANNPNLEKIVLRRMDSTGLTLDSYWNYKDRYLSDTYDFEYNPN